jgi:L-alanine-DL-glutamate epimerase-like enolase superfamily enzyme
LRVPFWRVSLYDRVAGLSLEIESYDLEPLELAASPEFMRKTTVIRLRGRGHEGVGEDVTYSAPDQEALQQEGPSLPLRGSHTLDAFSQLLDRLALWPSGPGLDQFRPYRRWAYESAALDLALRQAGTSLHQALGREPKPVTFVSSMRLGDPATVEPMRQWLGLYPALRFKLDPTSTWDDALVSDLVATAAVDTLDLKGAYEGTPVDQDADATLYARVAIAFPQAWIEDPKLTDETLPVLEAHSARVTWDAPIHSVADILGLPWRPRVLNFKPSRFGSIRSLFEGYEHCFAEGIGIYGGGQFELGPGRGQIQYLASIFHPDTPNDVAPGAYNGDPRPGLPTSPLTPAPSKTGFRWGD